MLDYKKLVLQFLLLFSCGSYSWQDKEHEIDDLINKSTLATLRKDYCGANNILINILASKNNFTLGQEVNIYYKLLELTFLNKDYGKSKEYGYKLHNLIKNNDKYSSLNKRLIYRLCESEDWAIARESFNDICKNYGKSP